MSVGVYGPALGILRSLPETPEVLAMIQEATAATAAKAPQTAAQARLRAIMTQAGKDLDADEGWKNSLAQAVTSSPEEA